MTLILRQAQKSSKNGPDIPYDPYPETTPRNQVKMVLTDSMTLFLRHFTLRAKVRNGFLFCYSELPVSPDIPAELDTCSPEGELSAVCIQQQEELLRQFQRHSPTPTSASTQPTQSDTHSYHHLVQSQNQSGLELQQRSGSVSRPSYSSDKASDHVVRGEVMEGTLSKVVTPVQVEEGAEGSSGNPDLMQQVQHLGLKDAVGDESGINPVYLMSKYQGSNRSCACIHTCVCAHTRMHTHTHTHTHSHLCTHTHMQVHCMHTCAHIHTHTHTLSLSHTHKHIHDTNAWHAPMCTHSRSFSH